jgi:hypothetical protein
LIARGVPTARGGQWTRGRVRSVLNRLRHSDAPRPLP